MVAEQLGIATIEFGVNKSYTESAHVEDGKFDVFSRFFFMRGFDKLNRMLGSMAVRCLGGRQVLMDSDRFAGCDKIGFARAIGACYYRPNDTPTAQQPVDHDAAVSVGGISLKPGSSLGMVRLQGLFLHPGLVRKYGFLLRCSSRKIEGCQNCSLPVRWRVRTIRNVPSRNDRTQI